MKAVEIEVDDQGQVTVGMPPASEETGAQDVQEDKSYMKPVQSVDQALQVAKDMLTGQSGAQAQAANAQTADQQMAQGFQKGQGQPAGFGAR